MEKKGTGWIPDLPDINDYTLESQAIQNLGRGGGIESQGFTNSIEDLAQKFAQALDILENHIKKINPGTEGSKTSKSDINILKKLRQEICGDFSFETVKFHNVFKVGMVDSEVILIKNYLQHILWTWPDLSSSNQKEDVYLDFMVEMIPNTEFNSKIACQLQKVLRNQKHLQISTDFNSIELGKDELETLKELAKLSFVITIDSAKILPILGDFTNKWKNWIDTPEQEEKLQEYKFGDFQRGQVYFIVHMYEMIKYLNQGLESSNDEQIKLSIENVLEFLSDEPTQDKTTDKKSNNNKELIVAYLQGMTRNRNNLGDHEEEIEAISNQKIWDKLIKEYDPSAGKSEGYEEKNMYKWINAEIEKLKELLKDSDGSLKTKIKEKIEEWQSVIKLVYKLIPPPIALLIEESEEISISSPIPLSIKKIIQKTLFSQSSLHSDSGSKVEFIIEIIAQMLMPLGKHNNLSQAVEQTIKKIQFLVKQKELNKENFKIFFQEIFEEYDFRESRNVIFLEDKDVKKIILGGILQILESEIKDVKTNDKEHINLNKDILQKHLEANIEKIEIATELNKEFPIKGIRQNLLLSIYKELQQYDESNLEDIKRFFQRKKPKFEIQKNEIQKNKDPLKFNFDNKPFQQIDKNLQFPINPVLRKRINEINDEKGEQTKIFLSLPEFVDLSYWCSPVEDQGVLNACTAHAGIALMEYAEKKKYGTYIDASPRFLYKVTRNLMQREGDSGASVRDMMKAMVAFGVCPEQYWSYNEDKFDEEPTPFCYSFAENYKTLKYFRIDYASISRHMLLAQVKVLLASEIPCIFGFTLYNSAYDEVNVQRGHIPLPYQHDKVVGGHTVVAVGYHDRKVIERTDGKKTEGALLIRNSWGTSWGQGGYGWLPYDYIIEGLTADWWSLLKAEWLATGLFGIGQNAYGDQGTNDPPKDKTGN